MRGLIIGVSLAIVLTQSGCGLFTEDATLEISTDQSTYLRGSTINVTAKNVSSDVIYYNSCMPTVLEELSDSKVAKRTAFPSCDCLCVTELRPGDEWNWGLNVDWLWANDGMFEPDLGPNHRLMFAFYTDSKLQHLIRPDELISNSFRFQNADAPAE